MFCQNRKTCIKSQNLAVFIFVRERKHLTVDWKLSLNKPLCYSEYEWPCSTLSREQSFTIKFCSIHNVELKNLIPNSFSRGDKRQLVRCKCYTNSYFVIKLGSITCQIYIGPANDCSLLLYIFVDEETKETATHIKSLIHQNQSLQIVWELVMSVAVWFSCSEICLQPQRTYCVPLIHEYHAYIKMPIN